MLKYMTFGVFEISVILNIVKNLFSNKRNSFALLRKTKMKLS
jgi:hypothetical protein